VVSSSSAKVTPLPIFTPSGDQSRRSYFASRPFQLIRLNCFARRLGLSRRTIIEIIETLIRLGLLNDQTPDADTRSHIYRVNDFERLAE